MPRRRGVRGRHTQQSQGSSYPVHETLEAPVHEAPHASVHGTLETSVRGIPDAPVPLRFDSSVSGVVGAYRQWGEQWADPGQ